MPSTLSRQSHFQNLSLFNYFHSLVNSSIQGTNLFLTKHFRSLPKTWSLVGRIQTWIRSPQNASRLIKLIYSNRMHHSKAFRLLSKIDWCRHAPILQVLSPLLFTLPGSSGWWRQNSDRSSELDLCYHKSLRCWGWKGLGNGVGLLYRGYRDQLPPSAVTTKMRLNSTAETNIPFNLQYCRFLFMNHFAMNLKWISLCPRWQPKRKENRVLKSPVNNLFQFAVEIFHSLEFVRQPVLKIQERQRAQKRHIEALLRKNCCPVKAIRIKYYVGPPVFLPQSVGKQIEFFCIALYRHLWSVWLYSTFAHYLLNKTNSREKLFNIKYVFGIVYNFFLQHFSFHEISEILSQICKGLYVKYQLSLSDYNNT